MAIGQGKYFEDFGKYITSLKKINNYPVFFFIINYRFGKLATVSNLKKEIYV